MSERRKLDWQNPGYAQSVIRGLNHKPTKPERRIIDICERHFPDFQYNGDLRLGVVLGGLIPDFVNVNGQKAVIEVFGDFWHSPKLIGNDRRRSEPGKIEAYNSVGYRCFVIWERDLKQKSEEELVEMIQAFSKGRR